MISPMLPRIRQFIPAIAPIITNFSHISCRMLSFAGALTGVLANNCSIVLVRSLMPPPRSPKAIPERRLTWRVGPAGRHTPPAQGAPPPPPPGPQAPPSLVRLTRAVRQGHKG